MVSAARRQSPSPVLGRRQGPSPVLARRQCPAEFGGSDSSGAERWRRSVAPVQRRWAAGAPCCRSSRVSVDGWSLAADADHLAVQQPHRACAVDRRSMALAAAGAGGSRADCRPIAGIRSTRRQKRANYFRPQPDSRWRSGWCQPDPMFRLGESRLSVLSPSL